MMRLFFFTALSILSIALAGCSDSKSGGKNPRNSEEALSNLPEEYKINFRNWKKQVVKACDASEALGLHSDHDLEEEGVDAALLIKTNGYSLVFSDLENAAVVTSYGMFAGYGSSRVERSINVNGKGYKLAAEAKRQGSSCTLYLYGQKVYETFIVQNLAIGTQWKHGVDIQTTSGPVQVEPLGVNTSQVDGQSIYALISKTFEPNETAIEVVAGKLGITLERAKRLMKLNSFSTYGAALKIEKDPSSVWTNSQSSNLIASGGVFETIFDGGEHVLPLELRLDLPQVRIGDVTNTADAGSLKVQLSIAVGKVDDKISYKVQSSEIHGLAKFDLTEAEVCATDRVKAYIGAQSGMSIQPSVDHLFSPCQTLHPDIEKASYDTGLMKSLIPIVFAEVRPVSNFQYHGWDQVLAKLSIEAIKAEKDLQSELDPMHRTLIVPQVSEYLLTIKNEIEQSAQVRQSRDAVYQMGMRWALLGHQVAPTRILEIVQAVDHSIEPFKASSERFLVDLGSNPNGLNDQLAFALAIDQEYKQAALDALKLAQDLQYQDFETMVFNVIIQRQPTLQELKDWSRKLGGIKTELQKYPNLGSQKGALVGLSLKWLKDGQVSMADLQQVYAAVNNTLYPFEKSTIKLIQDLQRSFSEQQDAVMFARGINADDMKLAVSIQENSKAAGFESWGSDFFDTILQKRPSKDDMKAWQNMWASALAFIQREKQRTAGEFGSSGEWNRKEVIENAIDERWSNHEFVALEAIAQVAVAKSACSRYKDASSLADCVGMRLFSKKQGKFFDPAFGGRYTALGKDFSGYMRQLSASEWSSLRWGMLDEFFGSFDPIWSKCDQNQFAKKSTDLKQQVANLLKARDQLQKWEIERKIKDSIDNCQ